MYYILFLVCVGIGKSMYAMRSWGPSISMQTILKNHPYNIKKYELFLSNGDSIVAQCICSKNNSSYYSYVDYASLVHAQNDHTKKHKRLFYYLTHRYEKQEYYNK